MRQLCLRLLALTMLALPATAQSRDETLADIRQELSVLYVEVQRLKRELSTTGGVTQPAVGGSVLDRVAAIEAELDTVVLLGWDKDGNEYMASSTGDGGDVMWLLERCKHRMLTSVEE